MRTIENTIAQLHVRKQRTMNIKNSVDSSSSADDMDLETIFADLEPIPQDDGPTPVCAILYLPDFVQAMDYFRAVLYKKEYSSRALDLTSVCLTHNPANYTIWRFRRECLATLSSSKSKIDEELVEKDLAFSAILGGPNPKNYQIWWVTYRVTYQANRCLYSQWFPGEENVIADYLSHDFHPFNDDLTSLLVSSLPL